jgi:hypothetical protein
LSLSVSVSPTHQNPTIKINQNFDRKTERKKEGEILQSSFQKCTQTTTDADRGSKRSIHQNLATNETEKTLFSTENVSKTKQEKGSLLRSNARKQENG